MYKIQAWAVDDRAPKPDDFKEMSDEERAEARPKGGWRNDSGKTKIRTESPPFENAQKAVNALAALMNKEMSDETIQAYHTIKIVKVGGNGESAELPTP